MASAAVRWSVKGLAMIATPKGQGRDQRSQLRPYAMDGDQVLSAVCREDKSLVRYVGKQDARSPAPVGRAFLLGHDSSLPRYQRIERLSRNYGPAPDANDAKPSRRDVVVERCPAKAGGLAGFPNAETDLRGIELGSLHVLFPCGLS